MFIGFYDRGFPRKISVYMCMCLHHFLFLYFFTMIFCFINPLKWVLDFTSGVRAISASKG